MTDVLIDGDRTYAIDPAGRTADAVAAEVAAAVLDVTDGQRFSLKVDGVVLKPGDTVGSAGVCELVDVTDYTWPETVALAETGSIVDDAPAEKRKRGQATDAEPDNG